jgi:Protein of unknown function (DUF1360)
MTAYYPLVLGSLCVWRATHLLNAEDGPWNMVVRLRRRAGEGFWGVLLDCFYCLSLWIAVPIAIFLGDGWKERLLLWPAISAGASLLQRFTSRKHPQPMAQYLEDEEMNNVLLRKEQEPIPSTHSESTTK